MKHVMIDLETMGLGNKAAIVAIGAVAFDGEGLKEEFYKAVTLESSMEVGLEVDAGTIMWWLKQSKEAQEYLLAKEAIDLPSALVDFIMWLKGDPLIWGNGATFDNVILSNAYDAVELSKPWKYWQDSCYRTIRNLNEDIPFVFHGVKHNALDDAKSQALHLIKIGGVV